MTEEDVIINPVKKSTKIVFPQNSKLILITEYKSVRESTAAGSFAASLISSTVDAEDKFVKDFRERFNNIENRMELLSSQMKAIFNIVANNNTAAAGAGVDMIKGEDTE